MCKVVEFNEFDQVDEVDEVDEIGDFKRFVEGKMFDNALINANKMLVGRFPNSAGSCSNAFPSFCSWI